MTDVRVWGNQYASGIVVTGGLAEAIFWAAEFIGETPEEFLENAIESKLSGYSEKG